MIINMKYLLLALIILTIPCFAQEWKATPRNCICERIDEPTYQYFWGDSTRSKTVITGVVVIPPDTLWQKSDGGMHIYFLEPWICIGDTIQFDATFPGVSKIDGLWRVDLRAVIRIKNSNAEMRIIRYRSSITKD